MRCELGKAGWVWNKNMGKKGWSLKIWEMLVSGVRRKQVGAKYLFSAGMCRVPEQPVLSPAPEQRGEWKQNSTQEQRVNSSSMATMTLSSAAQPSVCCHRHRETAESKVWEHWSCLCARFVAWGTAREGGHTSPQSHKPMVRTLQHPLPGSLLANNTADC